MSDLTPERNPGSITRRNRENAKLSTGPRTQEGKEIARANAVKHGLTASPVVAGAEDELLFEAIREQLEGELVPSNVIEAALVHRMAVSLWRLLRATRVDAALGEQRLARIGDERTEIHEHIQQFQRCWEWVEVEERDRDLVRRAREMGLVEPGQRWFRLKRTRLDYLDDVLSKMMDSRAGVEALLTLLEDLWKLLVEEPAECDMADLEQLAFLLGDRADSFIVNYNESELGDGRVYTEIGERPVRPGRLKHLLTAARLRDPGSPVPRKIVSEYRTRTRSLAQYRACFGQTSAGGDRDRRCLAALLPGATELDLLARYETHAERSLYRAIETLAKLRGVRVAVVAAHVRTGQSVGRG